MSIGRKIITLLVIFILITTTIYIYLEDRAAHSLAIDLKFKTLKLTKKGSISNITLVFETSIYNPSNFEFRIKRINYTVYIEGRYFGKGYIEDILVKPKSNITRYLNITLSTGELLSLVLGIIFRGDKVLNYNIKGNAYVPIEFISITIYSIKMKFTQKGNYTVPPSI